VMQFNFIGNDERSFGNFGIKYNDLRFMIYNKDGSKKINEVLTLVSKVVVKKSTNEKIKETYVEVERIPEKSFYNFLWRTILVGLKKTLIQLDYPLNVLPKGKE
jgi:hypothetical protein